MKREEFDGVRMYEWMKSCWIAKHPDSTPEQYEAAMKRIAKECGV